MRIGFRLDLLRQAILSALKLDRRIDDLKMNQGQLLAFQQLSKSSKNLADFEFRVFSQWGEDGILQFLTRNIQIRNRTFIEFGVEDFFESNCRYLMMKDLWRGFVIDGSAANIKRLQSSYFYWRYQIQSIACFVTAENICALLEESGFDKELGILSIDLDGIDYHILNKLKDWHPGILIVEYNAVFGNSHAVTVPYDPGFQRNRKHYSNLYFGASLPAFRHLTSERGYGFVGTNSMGSNAFFVRRDLLNDVVVELEPHEGYRDFVFRESRDSRGRLTLLSGDNRMKEIAGLPLVDVISGKSMTVADLVL